MLQLRRGHGPGGGSQRWRLDTVSRGLRPRDPINVQFTSGTTGAPKGATLTHHNIVNNAAACARAMRLGPGEALCIPVPLYHCFGMVLGNLTAAAYGVTMVFPGEGFDARETLAALEKVPRHVRFVTGMPLTATGKPQKFRMRERMMEELGVSAG